MASTMYLLGRGIIFALAAQCGVPIRLKQLREERELTQEALADKVGVTHAQVQRWENGKRNIPSNRVYKLAAVLKCHPGEIFAPLDGVTGVGGPEGRALEIARSLPPEMAQQWVAIGQSLAARVPAARPLKKAV